MQSIFLEDHGAIGLKVSSCPLDEIGEMMFAGRPTICNNSGESSQHVLPTEGRYHDTMYHAYDNADFGDNDDTYAEPCDMQSASQSEEVEKSKELLGNAVQLSRTASPQFLGDDLPASKHRRGALNSNPLSLMDPHDDGANLRSALSSAMAHPISKALRVEKCYKMGFNNNLSKKRAEYTTFNNRSCKEHGAGFLLSKISNFSRGADVTTLPSFKVSGLSHGSVLGEFVAQQRRETFLARLKTGDACNPTGVEFELCNKVTGCNEGHDLDFIDDYACHEDNDDIIDEVENCGDFEMQEYIGEDLEQTVSSRILGGEDGSTSFEVLCKLHIDKFIESAESYARETQLSRRISDWVEKLEPLLAEQDSRRVYDIAEYSDKVLCKASLCSINTKLNVAKEGLPDQSSTENSSSQNIDFEELVHGESAHEVSRFFVACLQLANFGNISISEVTGGHGRICGFNFSLLSSTRNKEVENYRAPSVANRTITGSIGNSI